MLANMANSLIEHKRINTTLAKAKALRVYLEPLVTKSKNNSTHSRRVVFSYLQNKFAIEELFSTVAEKVADRPGGYLRVIKTGFRKGDGAETALIEFVDFNDTYGAGAKAGGSKRRSRRSRKKGGDSDSVIKSAAGTSAAAGAVAAASAVSEQSTQEEE